MTQIYTGLETLMNEDKVYRKSDLSLEKAATMLNTNRTYLSQVVNENAGSFASYVNRYRLQEAIEILSDPKNTESLKCIGISVGFSSPSNFYTLFRQKWECHHHYSERMSETFPTKIDFQNQH